MTTNSWYEAVAADAPLTQGDLLENFPLVGWKSEAIQVEQAFARFFMRVGLPVPIDADWLEVYS